MLHPGWKLEYFREAGWKEAWIRNARRLLEDEFNRKYSDLPIDKEDDPEQSGNGESDNDDTTKVCLPAVYAYRFTYTSITGAQPI